MKNLFYECEQVSAVPLSRRDWLRGTGAGFGFVAFAGLAAQMATQIAGDAHGSESQNPLLPKSPHFPARAKRVIFLTMAGGPSHLDTFDYKPELSKRAGQSGPGRGNIVPSPFTFKKHGKSGLWISEVFPHLAKHADELCIINGMHTDVPNHAPAMVHLHTGNFRAVRPSMGAWTVYGLGTENQNLPGFITINPGNGAQNYGSAFLPAIYQGTRLGEGGGRKRGPDLDDKGVDNIRNDVLTQKMQRRQLDFIQAMNRDLMASPARDPQVEGVIESFELAFRMQKEVPEVMDLSKEPANMLKLYGVGEKTDGFARQCLLARRLVEAGVRFVEITQGGWDHHNTLSKRLAANAEQIDLPIAALLTDLRQRGLLKDTLIVWGGEFGRTPGNNRPDGRAHNAKGYSMWMAGGGVKTGQAYGATDDLGYSAVQNKVHLHDLHATMLHLLGLDHTKLTYRYAGRDFRLTDVYGTVVQGLLS